MIKEFIYTVKVYYEDTDSGGVVYYANYLKFLERARSEAINLLGFKNKDLIKKNGIFIIVKSCNIDYKKSAVLEDKLVVKSLIKSVSKTSFYMKQNIYRDEKIITEAEIRLVSVNKKGKPVKIPEKLSKKLKAYSN